MQFVKKEKYLNLIKEVNYKKSQLCEICKPIHELSWLFVHRMLYVFRHDE